MISADFKKFHFTILFTNLKSVCEGLNSFFFYRDRLEQFSLQSQTEYGVKNWFDPLPGGSHLPSFFLGELELPTNTPATLFLSNLGDGWTTGARKLSQNSQSRSIKVDMSRESQYSIFRYEVIESGRTTRVIQLHNEERWKFFQQGDALSYEDQGRYLKKSADRLSNEVIVDYLRAEGINFGNLLNQNYEGILYKQLA